TSTTTRGARARCATLRKSTKSALHPTRRSIVRAQVSVDVPPGLRLGQSARRSAIAANSTNCSTRWLRCGSLARRCTRCVVGRWAASIISAPTDPRTADQLRQTYHCLEPAEVQKATRELLAIYERICPAYCKKACIAYPAEDLSKLHRVLDECDAL